MVDSAGQQAHISSSLEHRIRSEFPHLSPPQVEDVARIVDVLVRTFDPLRIYVFGSQARGTPNKHSDVDLFVVMPDGDLVPYRLAQEAYGVIGRHVLPLEIVFMSRSEFEWRLDVPTSLPSTIRREGRLLYGT